MQAPPEEEAFPTMDLMSKILRSKANKEEVAPHRERYLKCARFVVSYMGKLSQRVIQAKKVQLGAHQEQLKTLQKQLAGLNRKSRTTMGTLVSSYASVEERGVRFNNHVSDLVSTLKASMSALYAAVVAIEERGDANDSQGIDVSNSGRVSRPTSSRVKSVKAAVCSKFQSKSASESMCKHCGWPKDSHAPKEEAPVAPPRRKPLPVPAESESVASAEDEESVSEDILPYSEEDVTPEYPSFIPDVENVLSCLGVLVGQLREGSYDEHLMSEVLKRSEPQAAPQHRAHIRINFFRTRLQEVLSHDSLEIPEVLMLCAAFEECAWWSLELYPKIFGEPPTDLVEEEESYLYSIDDIDASEMPSADAEDKRQRPTLANRPKSIQIQPPGSFVGIDGGMFSHIVEEVLSHCERADRLQQLKWAEEDSSADSYRGKVATELLEEYEIWCTDILDDLWAQCPVRDPSGPLKRVMTLRDDVSITGNDMLADIQEYQVEDEISERHPHFLNLRKVSIDTVAKTFDQYSGVKQLYDFRSLQMVSQEITTFGVGRNDKLLKHLCMCVAALFESWSVGELSSEECQQLVTAACNQLLREFFRLKSGLLRITGMLSSLREPASLEAPYGECMNFIIIRDYIRAMLQRADGVVRMLVALYNNSIHAVEELEWTVQERVYASLGGRSSLRSKLRDMLASVKPWSVQCISLQTQSIIQREVFGATRDDILKCLSDSKTQMIDGFEGLLTNRIPEPLYRLQEVVDALDKEVVHQKLKATKTGALSKTMRRLKPRPKKELEHAALSKKSIHQLLFDTNSDAEMHTLIPIASGVNRDDRYDGSAVIDPATAPEGKSFFKKRTGTVGRKAGKKKEKEASLIRSVHSPALEKKSPRKGAGSGDKSPRSPFPSKKPSDRKKQKDEKESKK